MRNLGSFSEECLIHGECFDIPNSSVLRKRLEINLEKCVMMLLGKNREIKSDILTGL